MDLRLLVTKECPRSCPGCCNGQWNLDELPTTDDADIASYNMIMITGGEPMLYPFKVGELIKEIRGYTSAPIIMYTADSIALSNHMWLLRELDGVTLTLHNPLDALEFRILNQFVMDQSVFSPSVKSLRLNSFIKKDLLSDFNLYWWKVKHEIEWIDPCPLPDNEDFRKLPNLWKEEK